MACVKNNYTYRPTHRVDKLQQLHSQCRLFFLVLSGHGRVFKKKKKKVMLSYDSTRRPQLASQKKSDCHFSWRVLVDRKGICYISVIKVGRVEQDVFSHLFYICLRKVQREILRENAGIRLQKVSRFGDCTNETSGSRVMSRLQWKGKHPKLKSKGRASMIIWLF